MDINDIVYFATRYEIEHLRNQKLIIFKVGLIHIVHNGNIPMQLNVIFHGSMISIFQMKDLGNSLIEFQ